MSVLYTAASIILVGFGPTKRPSDMPTLYFWFINMQNRPCRVLPEFILDPGPGGVGIYKHIKH